MCPIRPARDVEGSEGPELRALVTVVSVHSRVGATQTNLRHNVKNAIIRFRKACNAPVSWASSWRSDRVTSAVHRTQVSPDRVRARLVLTEAGGRRVRSVRDVEEGSLRPRQPALRIVMFRGSFAHRGVTQFTVTVTVNLRDNAAGPPCKSLARIVSRSPDGRHAS